MFCLITYKLRAQLITFNCSLDNMIRYLFFAQLKRLKSLPLIKTIIASIFKSSVIPYRKTISRKVSSYHFHSWDTCLLSNFNNQFHCQSSMSIKWINDSNKILPNRAIPILPETMQNGHFLCIIVTLCLFGNKRKISLY